MKTAVCAILFSLTAGCFALAAASQPAQADAGASTFMIVKRDAAG